MALQEQENIASGEDMDDNKMEQILEILSIKTASFMQMITKI